jgi:hypothetical protein
MRRGRRFGLRILSALPLAWLLAAGSAGAEHTRERRITDETAYTLPARDLRLGLWKVEYGILDSLDVGTYWWVWFLKVANAKIKWRWYFEDPWAFALKLEAFHVDTADLGHLDEDLGTGSLSILSAESFVSHRFSDQLTLSGSLIYTHVWIDGEINVEAFDGTAAGAVDNLQMTVTGEYRLSEVTALLIHARYLAFQRLHGRGYVRLDPDEYTSVEIHGGGKRDAFDFPHAWSVTPAVAFSWGVFNLRGGVGYGHWSVPGLNFVKKKRGWLPELDVYFVF